MTSSTSSFEPGPVCLDVSFDVNQLGSQLHWRIEEDGTSTRNLFRRVGRHAGSVHFLQGDLVSVRVTGFCGTEADDPKDPGPVVPADYQGFAVHACTVLTVPRLRQEKVNYEASPFILPASQESRPSIEVGGFEYDAAVGYDMTLQAYRYVGTSRQALQVAARAGIWELSMVVAVDIRRAQGPLLRRVFRFDPESEVGTGTMHL